MLGHPLAPWLKILFLPRTGSFLDEHKFKLLLSVLLPALALRLRKLQARIREEKRALEELAQKHAEATASNPQDALYQMKGFKGASDAVQKKLPTTYEILRGPLGSMGFQELGACIVSCMLSAVVMVRKGWVLGQLLARQNDVGISEEWFKYAAQYPFYCLLNVAFSDSIGYFKRRIQLKWRRTVTGKLHDLYFSRMRYYRILNEEQEWIITDPDIRICTDVGSLIGSTADVVVALTTAIFYTVCFGTASMANRSWKWSAAVPLFFLVARFSVNNVDPPGVWTSYGFLQYFQSKLTQMMTRVQLHAERICMLQGEWFELKHVQEGMAEIATHSRNIANLLVPRFAMETFFFSSPDGAAAIECTAMLTCTCMGSNDVVAALTAADQTSQLPLDVLRPAGWAPQHMATMMENMHGFFNACTGWGSLNFAIMALQDMHHITTRLKELFYKLENIQDSHGGGSNIFEERGPVIAFERVTIETPSHQVLLEDLSFTVEQGSSLLICGHNGAGKSSIIRALCSLWSVPTGVIVRPGGCLQAEENKSLHSELYYLPQKPSNVLGSLSDQLTYPLRVEGGLPEKELRRWLKYVGLEYLVDRKVGASSPSRVKGAEEQDIDWEVLLSMGEQQALSIARLLYHHPRFAILDECTSAVGRELERRLFDVVREIGISCITITHRPALKEHHQSLLQLTGKREKDGRGWEMSPLEHARPLPPTKPRCDHVEELHRRMEAYLKEQEHSGDNMQDNKGISEHVLVEERSVDYKHLAATASSAATADSLVRQRWPNRLQRIWAVVKLGLPSRAEKMQACKRVAIMLLAVRFRVWVFWFYWRGMGGMLLGSFAGDKPRVLSEYAVTLLTTAASACLDHLFKNQVDQLALDLWVTTMRDIPGRVLSGDALLSMLNPREGSPVPEVESPVLRLSELKETFEAMRDQLKDVVLPVAQGIAMLPAMVTGLGGLAPLLLVVNFMLFRGSQLIAPNFPSIQKRTSMLESRFQVLHTRLRSIAEPVAFSGGGDAERRIIEPHFDRLLEHYESSSRKETLYNMMVTAFTDYRQIPLWTQRLASIQFAQRSNPEHPDGVSAATIITNFLVDRTVQYPQVAVQKLVKLTEASGRIDGQCLRVLELIVACDAVEAAAPPEGLQAELPANGDGIAVFNLDLVTRRGVCLAKGMTFEIKQGAPTVCTGPNATGKSLLGMVLLGLWPSSGEGATVSMPGAETVRPPLSTIMPAPQHIYLPGGFLTDQIIYPVPVGWPGLPVELRTGPLSEEVDEAALWEHMAPLGCTWVQIHSPEDETASRFASIWFSSFEGACFSVGVPHQRVVRGQELDLGFHGEVAEKNCQFPNFPRMRRCLKAVGIDHILTREPLGWLTDKDWADVLSGGEQQRLCLARVLYHGPKFGLLDECTSMVAVDAEQDLYRLLFREWGITPLTLTQRLFMPDFYRQEVRLGVHSKAGWEVVAGGGDSAELVAEWVTPQRCSTITAGDSAASPVIMASGEM